MNSSRMWMPTRRNFLPLLSIVVLFLLLSLDAIYGTQDICLISTCQCWNETHYVKISCDFLNDEEYKLNSQFTFPALTISILIKLGDKSKLILGNGFFPNRNKVNSMVIQGSNKHFELTTNSIRVESFALENVGGNFPEIIFANLNNVVLHEKSLDARRNLEINLSIEGVWTFQARREIFGQTSYNASFNDIAELRMDEGVLESSNYNLTRPKIIINQSSIRELLPLRGKKLTELKIVNSQIESITESAFSVREINLLALDNVTIQTIHTKSFSNGILVKHLAVHNCKITNVQTEAIKDLGVEKIIIENNVINSIDHNAIEFVGAFVRFVRNEINFMKPKWFSISHWSKIDIFNNTFGSFDSMQLENPTDDAECAFNHNSFTQLAKDSYKLISEKCQFTEILFKQNCACSFESWLASHFLKSHDRKKLKKESFCSLDMSDSLSKCFGTQTIKYQDYHEEICNRKRTKLRCEKMKTKIDKVEANFIDPKILMDDFDWWDYKNHIIFGAAAVIFLLCLICVIKVATKPKRDMNYSRDYDNADLVQLNPAEGPPTYQVTINQDFVIIKRTLEMMKEKQPTEKYEAVEFNTKRLLYDHIDEYEKVKVIGDIVQTISECENTGEDFVAFTDILYKYLAADAIPRNEDLYAEPTLLRNETDAIQSKSKKENIYAEPIVAPALTTQRKIITTEMPIMTANYSSPIDNSSNNNHLYSEPIIFEPKIGSSTFKPKVATPYAISQTLDVPTTSQNLPDILERPGTSATEPFRINRSPTSNRIIPEYTVPSTSHKIPIRVTKDNLEDWSDELTDGSTNSNTSSYSGSSKQTVKIDEIIH